MEHLKVTLTHKETNHRDSDIVSPYNPAAKKEQANTLEKTIRDRNNWKKDEYKKTLQIIST